MSASNKRKRSYTPEDNEQSKKKYHFNSVVPVSVDIGGSFTKMVYWRPQDPPDLPSYIIKEFENGGTNFPIRPDASLKISLSDGMISIQSKQIVIERIQSYLI
jgi:hypothetical protein